MALRLFLLLLLLLEVLLLLLWLCLLLLLLFICLLPQIFFRRLFRDQLLWQLLIPHVPVPLQRHLLQIYFAPVRPPDGYPLYYCSSPMQFHLVAFTFFPLYSSTLFPNNSLACVYRSSSRRMLVVCFCFSCCLFNIPEVSPHSSAKHGTPSRCSPAPALRWLYVFNLLSPYHVRSVRQRCFAGIALSFLVFEDGLGISQLTLCAAELLDEMYRCVHMEKSFLALW